MKSLHIALSRPSADYHELSYDATIIIMITACKIDESNREVYVYFKYGIRHMTVRVEKCDRC